MRQSGARRPLASLLLAPRPGAPPPTDAGRGIASLLGVEWASSKFATALNSAQILPRIFENLRPLQD